MLTIVLLDKDLGESVRIFMGGIWETLLLNITGLWFVKLNNAVWYLSAMLLCMAIIYPLLRKYKNASIYVILPLAMVLIYGWMYKYLGSFRSPTEWIGFTYRGVPRAFADLCLGVICYQLTQRFAKLDFNAFAKLLLTVVKYVGYLALVLYMSRPQPEAKLDYFFLIVYFVVIGLTFSGQTFGGAIFNNKLVSFLGKLSFSLYLSHYWQLRILKVVMAGASVKEMYIAYFAISFATAFVVMGISSLLRKFKTPLLSIPKKLFIKKKVESN